MSKDAPVDITESLRQVETAVKTLMGSGLSRKAILILLAHETKLSQRQVGEVLNAAANITKLFLSGAR